MAKRRPGGDERADPDRPEASGEDAVGEKVTDGGRRAENPANAEVSTPPAVPGLTVLADTSSASVSPDEHGDVPSGAGSPAVDSGTRRSGAHSLNRSSARPARRARSAFRARLGREVTGVMVLVVLALVCVGLITAVVLKSEREAATAAREVARYSPPRLVQTPALSTNGPVIAIIGDESLTDAVPGVDADARWTSLLGDRLDAQVVPVAAAGYTVRSSDGDTFVEAAAKVPADARVVLFVGGAADDATSTLSLARAATEAFAAAIDRAPKASVVAVGPLFTPSDVDATDLADVRSALQGAALIADVRWVDPVRSKWLGADIAASRDLDEAAEGTIANRLRSVVQSEID